LPFIHLDGHTPQYAERRVVTSEPVSIWRRPPFEAGCIDDEKLGAIEYSTTSSRARIPELPHSRGECGT
jgi:hypothetical protein